jgi:hypothetical protein
MRVNDFKINEDAKMAKATDEKIIALLMQFSKMDLSSPANEFMFKRVRKEFKKRNISLSPEQMKSFIGAQRSIDKVKIGEDEGDMGDEDFRDGHDLGLLKQVSAQIAQDVANNDYTAIDDLLKNVSEAEMRGFLSEVGMESVQEDMDPKGPEVTIGDYTTKNFYMCGGAIDTAEKFPDNEGMEKLIRLQDLMFGLEADVMNGMEATDEVIEFGTELTDAIMDQAKVAGIEKEVEEYQPMHLAAIKTGDPEPGYGRVDTEEED